MKCLNFYIRFQILKHTILNLLYRFGVLKWVFKKRSNCKHSIRVRVRVMVRVEVRFRVRFMVRIRFRFRFRARVRVIKL